MDRYGNEKDLKTLIRQGKIADAMRLTGGSLAKKEEESQENHKNVAPPEGRTIN